MDKLKKPSQVNFKALASLLAKYSNEIEEFTSTSPKSAHYTGWTIQNEIIQLISGNLSSREVARINNSVCWDLSFGETPDISKKEQITIVVRFLDSKFAVQEVLLGFYDAFSLADSHSLTRDTLASVIN